MLRRFSVSNFRGFKDEFVFSLDKIKGYKFNESCVKSGIVNNAIVYGHNGVGKSNLSFAVFDIIKHLTDKESVDAKYSYYLNAASDSKIAEFKYEFVFNQSVVIYEYGKTDYKTLVYERFFVNDHQLASIDRRKNNKAIVKFKGAENLKSIIPSDNLSLLKYVKNNTVLDNSFENHCFHEFMNFVDNMLFFRSLQENMYLGLEKGSKVLIDDIIDHNNVLDFETFLKKAEIDCKLTVMDLADSKTIAFDFGKKQVPFLEIASQGTRALTLFYYWLQRLRSSNVSFLIIDEFNAYYHYELSELIVKELKKIGVQFILTTHSTELMSNELLRPDCNFIMTKSEIKSLADCTDKELRQAHNLEKMYKAGVFNVK